MAQVIIRHLDYGVSERLKARPAAERSSRSAANSLHPAPG